MKFLFFFIVTLSMQFSAWANNSNVESKTTILSYEQQEIVLSNKTISMKKYAQNK